MDQISNKKYSNQQENPVNIIQSSNIQKNIENNNNEDKNLKIKIPVSKLNFQRTSTLKEKDFCKITSQTPISVKIKNNSPNLTNPTKKFSYTNTPDLGRYSLKKGTGSPEEDQDHYKGLTENFLEHYDELKDLIKGSKQLTYNQNSSSDSENSSSNDEISNKIKVSSYNEKRNNLEINNNNNNAIIPKSRKRTTDNFHNINLSIFNNGNNKKKNGTNVELLKKSKTLRFDLEKDKKNDNEMHIDNSENYNEDVIYENNYKNYKYRNDSFSNTANLKSKTKLNLDNKDKIKKERKKSASKSKN